MRLTRARRVLIAAFVVSLLIHAIVVVFVRFGPPPQPAAPEVVTLIKRSSVRIARHTPPPRPTPTPRPQPSATPARVHAPILPPHPAASAAGPRTPAHTVAVATAAPSATPMPTATPAVATSPSQGCSTPNAPAALATSPPAPDLGAAARTTGTNGTTRVTVQLDPQAHVTSAMVAASSGNTELDLAAAQLARDATYTPQYANCKAVAGSYVFSVRFVAW